MIRPLPTLSVLAGVLAAGLMGLPAGAQTPAVYPDGRGGEVHFPLGDISFADEVVSFTPGDPASGPDESIPEEVLGPPDYVDTVDDNYLTLGCGGVLELRFTDNALVDVVSSALEEDARLTLQRATREDTTARLDQLTGREREVMVLILAGKFNKVIADELNISMRTVEVHRARVFEKMGVRSAVELAQQLTVAGLYNSVAPAEE